MPSKCIMWVCLICRQVRVTEKANNWNRDPGRNRRSWVWLWIWIWLWQKTWSQHTWSVVRWWRRLELFSWFNKCIQRQTSHDSTSVLGFETFVHLKASQEYSFSVFSTERLLSLAMAFFVFRRPLLNYTWIPRPRIKTRPVLWVLVGILTTRWHLKMPSLMFSSDESCAVSMSSFYLPRLDDLKIHPYFILIVIYFMGKSCSPWTRKILIFNYIRRWLWRVTNLQIYLSSVFYVSQLSLHLRHIKWVNDHLKLYMP